MSVETPVVQNNTPVKVSRRGGYNNRPRPFLSDKDTPPLRDVYREGRLIEGISEAQMIREGIRAPLQYQNETKLTSNGEVRQVGRFEKTSKEREDWKSVHTNSKMKSGSIPRVSNARQIKSTLIIHRVNIHHRKDFNTTISLQAYPNEVNRLVSQFHNPQKHCLVNKYYYRGETLEVA